MLPKRKCPRCGQPDNYWRKEDGEDAKCDHCWFIFTEVYKLPIRLWENWDKKYIKKKKG